MTVPVWSFPPEKKKKLWVARSTQGWITQARDTLEEAVGDADAMSNGDVTRRAENLTPKDEKSGYKIWRINKRECVIQKPDGDLLDELVPSYPVALDKLRNLAPIRNANADDAPTEKNDFKR
ncbi:MAG: hypothetical protein ACM3Q1_02685 [Bacteroidales bacterium]